MCIAILSAIYAGVSAKEAKKANSIGRMNALLSFRDHYSELMKQETKAGETLKDIPSGFKAVHDRYAELDTKYREITTELDKYHDKIVNNKV